MDHALSPDLPPPMVTPPTPGRIVLVHLPALSMIKAASVGQVRPAMVVRQVSPTQCNVVVFLDGPNDVIGQHMAGDTVWLGTVDYAPAEFGTPRTWHWPPRVGG